MGSLSVSTHRCLLHWQGLLVAMSFINFWCLPNAVQPTILRTKAAKGEDVHLRIHNMPPNSAGVTWYKGKGENNKRIIGILTANSRTLLRGPPYGHMMMNHDGSLLIKNVTRNDRGWYTAAVRLENLKKKKRFRQLKVYEPMRVPTLIASNTIVTENKDMLKLTCYTKAISIQWLFNGRILQPSERIKMYRAHRILTINPVRREDAGIYKCKVSNFAGSVESAPLELDVKYE